MKKALAYTIWLIVSLAVLAVVRNIATYEFPQYSAIIMAITFGAVVYALFEIKGRFAKPATKHNQESNGPRS